ncbi:isocitrate lyase/PEP mutase family protein [Bradyrhizobium sp. WSM 1704]|uniref:isocitrate lyase/PEP mutase family protein n=1 Tax=Bradyrhizobium semiaridum TaxID=2821404 RepID=UPI001CE26FA4|nr:isocitrate lyase/PEP mutase family protein [Bradyrhizobium semiaridum]MCA6123176.1 isocitrate lyase/PEP mutase family protein [Bradyrhizobium semiaridum]
MSRHARFRQLIDQGFTTVGCYDVLTARMTENAGYPAVYLGGFAYELSGIGAPDMGLMSLPELSHTISRIASVTTVPIFCDIDTGFGGPNNIWRTVQDLERAGASGVQIEDQVFPKLCPVLPGKSLVSVEEGAARIRTAAAARASKDFVNIARTDADIVSVDELIARSNAYLAAGADVVLPMMLVYDGKPHTEADPSVILDQYRRLVREIRGPVMCLDSVPGSSLQDMQKLGCKIVLSPTSAIQAAFDAVGRLLRVSRETGRPEAYFHERGASLDRLEIMQAVGVESYVARDTAFKASPT